MVLEALIICSERAANIARKCRQDEHLFKLLIEEKNENEANPRFVQDFKTLADVLIQETLKHDIGNQYPEMREQIKGEESNVFCNTMGEQISVEKLETSNETADLLSKVLNDDVEAARVLAEEVHRELTLQDVDTRAPENVSFEYSKLGIWIDPIDSTAEYINGTHETEDNIDPNQDQLATSGLKCVTVLIGVYDLESGDPVMGIINQPFYSYQNGRWRGKCYWGIHGTTNCSSLFLPKTSSEPIDLTKITTTTEPETKTFQSASMLTNIVCLSGSEDQKIKDKLKSGGFELVEAPGAGYKMLAVVVGLADVYLLSKSSTFKWDSCGPHALLKSCSGDIVVYEEAVQRDNIVSVKYNVDQTVVDSKIDRCCNKGGIIVFKDYEVMKKIVELLRDCDTEEI